MVRIASTQGTDIIILVFKSFYVYWELTNYIYKGKFYFQWINDTKFNDFQWVEYASNASQMRKKTLWIRITVKV